MTYQPTEADIANEGAYLAKGLKIVGHGRDVKSRMFLFNECGHEQVIETAAARNGRFKCKSCHENRLRNEAKDAGLELIDLVDGNHCCYRFPCGHKQVIHTAHIRIRNYRCRSCIEDKLRMEASSIGLKFVSKIDKNYSLYILSCGHEQVMQPGAVRNSRFKCKTCHYDKLSSEAASAGLEFLELTNGGYARYKFSKCGHDKVICISDVRNISFRCNICEDTWATVPSNLYLHKIELGNMTLLKFGRARNVEQRTTKYGMPVGTVLTVLATWPTKTGLEANGIETLVAKQFKRYPKSKAKLILQDSGWTECFHVDDEKAIIDFVESKLS